MNRSGFTLLELMIVLIIIAILATLAYPTYRHVLHRQWRSQVIAELRQGEVAATDYYFENKSYVNLSKSDFSFSDAHYNFSLSNLSKTTFKIMATPTFNDSECGAFSVDQLGILSSAKKCDY